VSRQSKIAVLESILVRVQCRANAPREPQLAVVEETPAAAEAAVRPVEVEPPELIPIDEPVLETAELGPPELIPIDEPVVEPAHVAPPAIAEVKMDVPVAPVVLERRESLPPWPEPDEIEEPAPPSSPRLRAEDEIEAEEVLSAADIDDEADERITLPPVSGPQHVEGVSPERVVTLAPASERPGPVLDMDISIVGERSATPPPAAPVELAPAPLELVESAEPPAVQAGPPSVRLMVEPGPSAPGQTLPTHVAVEVRADAIHPPERAAASVAIFQGEATRFAPKSIGELLDATLGLGR
jgi:hypothetical protein